jgi:hypothetical protein
VQTCNEISWGLFKSLSPNLRRWDPERLATKLGHNELVYVSRRKNTAEGEKKIRTEIEIDRCSQNIQHSSTYKNDNGTILYT